LKKFFSNDSFLKIFSFVIAIIIWFYIIIVLDPPIALVVRDIPIRYVQQNVLTEQGLSIVDESQSTIELKIEGSRKKIVNINSKNVLATVDLSAVTKAGKHTLPINLSIPYEYKEIVSKKPHSVEVVVDKLVEEKRNIRIKTTGNPETGYIAGTPEINPKTVLLKGAASIISNVADVRVTVDIDDRKEDLTDNIEIELVDTSGNVITERSEIYELISADVSEVEIFCPILKLKTVPIKVQLSGTVPEGANVSVQPNMVTVFGYEEDIEKIEEILTKEISVETVLGAGQSVELVLPENIALRDSVSTVTVKINESVAAQE